MEGGYYYGHRVWLWRDDDIDEIWWLYDDSGMPVDGDDRPCKKCGHYPTKEGYDACLGYIPGAWWACCGHGVEERRVMYKSVNDKTYKENNVPDLNCPECGAKCDYYFTNPSDPLCKMGIRLYRCMNEECDIRPVVDVQSGKIVDII